MWDFIQDQILGMKWLKSLIYGLFDGTGLSTEKSFGSFSAFFFYDVLKLFILLCAVIFVISFIQSYFPPERTKKVLGPMKGLSAKIIAALMGTVTPFCSCSSIPIFIGFASAGLPVGTCFAFLISSPMVDLGSLVLLTGIFGVKTAVLYVILGLVIAIAGALLIEALGMDDQLADFLKVRSEISVQILELSFYERLEYAFNQLKSTVKRVWLYIIAGVFIGSAIHNWIPQNLVVRLLGKENPLAVVTAVLCGIPMYADIFGTVPVAEALLEKGAGLGVCLSFMMAVTTLSVPSLIMLSKAVKKKLLWVFIAVCTFGIITAGYIFNFL